MLSKRLEKHSTNCTRMRHDSYVSQGSVSLSQQIAIIHCNLFDAWGEILTKDLLQIRYLLQNL